MAADLLGLRHFRTNHFNQLKRQKKWQSKKMFYKTHFIECFLSLSLLNMVKNGGKIKRKTL